jgi:phosphoesterase RecJ-like protein
MRKNNFRGGRIGEEIKRLISDMLLRELKDPGFSGFVSVSAVKASGDGSFATVYVTMLGSGSGADSEATDEEKQSVLDAFERSKGLIRHEIGHKLGLRYAPDLRFVFDTSEEYGRRIEKILGELGIEPEPAVKPMNTLADIAGALKDSETVRIFPHENMDGDTLGASVALCLALRSQGIDCAVVISEKIPDNISFIEYGCCIDASDSGELAENSADGGGLDPVYSEYDMAVLIDVGEVSRLPGREALFSNGAETLCIDHHVSSKAIYDYNYIDTSASAAGEVVYDLAKELGVEPDNDIATAVYVCIVTDTGRFQYSNTTSKTHMVAAELLERGVEPNAVSTEIYQNVRMEKLLLENAVMSTMETIADGKCVLAYISHEALAQTGAIDEEYEGISEKLRGIRGVEVAVFLRETTDGRTKGSLRSKKYYDVAALAKEFDGGGHVRAAGFTTDKPLADVSAEIRGIIGESL